MLPFLQPKKMSTVIDAKTKPEGGMEDMHHDDGMMAAAEDLIKAVHAKDTKGVADALMAAKDLGSMGGDKEDFLSSEG